MTANDNFGGRKHTINHFDHMAAHDAWWQEARKRLDWQPIQTLPRDLGDMALAEPVILQSPYQWVLGHWYEGRWIKVTEGGVWKLDHFQPQHQCSAASGSNEYPIFRTHRCPISALRLPHWTKSPVAGAGVSGST